MSANKTTLKIILPLVILAVVFIIMRVLIANRPVPLKEDRVNPGALVQTIAAIKENPQAEITGTGTVRADQEVTVVMQVSGRVNQIAPGFAAGNFFKKGDLLFSVESVDYELGVEKARAALAKAETDLALTESKARIALQEWERLGSDKKPKPLVVYEPQLADARANLAAAAAGLKQAELDLSRCRVTAPFNCRVRSEEIAPGQYVRTGTSVAMLASIDRAEIIVALPLDALAWLNLPGREKGAKGSEAIIHVHVNNHNYQWLGRIDRSLGEIDPKTRMAQVVVAVDDPYKKSHENNIALEVGMFVEVNIQGRNLDGMIVLPRKALRDKSTVWIMDVERKLRIREVETMRFENDQVWVSAGLDEGDQVILTALPGAADGMQLRPVVKESAK